MPHCLLRLNSQLSQPGPELLLQQPLCGLGIFCAGENRGTPAGGTHSASVRPLGVVVGPPRPSARLISRSKNLLGSWRLPLNQRSWKHGEQVMWRWGSCRGDGVGTGGVPARPTPAHPVPHPQILSSPLSSQGAAGTASVATRLHSGLASPPRRCVELWSLLLVLDGE